MSKQIKISFRLSFLCIWIGFLFLFISKSHAQTPVLDTIGARLEDFNKNNFQEKIFVHTDKEFYLAGEIAWFKIYQTNSGSNRSFDFSRLAYIEIIDKEQKPVLQAKISIDNGRGNGSLYLPVSLPSGNYQFRAYTNWMKNYSPDYFFEKSISIVNTLKKPEKPKSDDSSDLYDIQFFPEGGQMVESLPGKVAFRAIDKYGKGVDINGILTDENNNTLLRFRPLKFGIGNFSFTPEAGKTYRALIELPGKKTMVKEIPVIKAGYVLSLKDLPGDKLMVSVQTNTILSAQQVYLFIHTRQEAKATASVLLNAGKGEFLMDKNMLGEGISHFTIFSSAGQAVCERLYFKRPVSKLLIDAKADQQLYAPRKKVTISLNAKDENGVSIEADASIAVYTSNSTESDDVDIFNYLWLKSDLKGNIESPGYYFKNIDPVANEALDNLMLTHGWRRFVWQDIMTKNIPAFKFLPEIEGQIISGEITDARTGEPAANILTYLSVPGKKLHLYGSRSDSAGNIRFYTKGIYGPSEIVVQTKPQPGSTYQIKILNPFLEKYSDASSFLLDLTENLRNQLLIQSVSSQVQNIYVENKLSIFYPFGSDSTTFYLKPDKKYLLDNFVRFNTMEEVLREYVYEVPVTRQRDDFSIWVSVRPHPNDIPKNVEPLIILDGVPIFDPGNKIMNYDPKKVREIEIISKKYFLGPLSFNSIINFKTYKGNLPDFQLNSEALVMDYEGLQLKREFYSPVYETGVQISNRVPDFRNLLYWSPDIKISASGMKTISFYTSDQENDYTVVIQGLSVEGKAGATKFNIGIKK